MASVVVAIASVGIQKSPVVAGIACALYNDRIVLAFRLVGDPAEVSADFVGL